MNYRLLFLLAALMPLPTGLTIIYVPAMPQMARFFAENHTWVQLSMTSYYLTYCCTQLLWGPLSDRFGRRPTLLTALFILATASLGLIFVTDIPLLWLGRALQGLGTACIAVNYKAMIVDRFEGALAYKNSALINGFFCLGPLFPMIGSLFVYYAHWQAISLFLCVYAALFLLISMIWLPETLSKSHKHSLAHTAANYTKILSNPSFWLGSICLGCVVSLFFSFHLLASFYFIDELKITELTYGHISFFVGSGYFIGTFLNRFLLTYISPKDLIFSGALIIILCGLLLLILLSSTNTNVFILAIPLWIVAIADSSIFSNMMIHLQNHFDLPNGLVSASIGVGFGLIVSLMTSIMSLIHITNLAPLGIITIILGTIIFALSLMLERKLA